MATDAAEEKPSQLRVWLLATRPNTLTASLSPILGARAPAVSPASPRSPLRRSRSGRSARVAAGLPRLGPRGAVGADTERRVGQARATQKGWLTPAEVSAAALAAVAVQVAIGLHLALCQEWGSWPFGYMLLVTVTSAINAFAYTGGEFPLGYVGLGWLSIGYAGLGDVFVFVYFGLVSTVTPYVLQARDVPPAFLLWIAAAVGCLATSIIVVNNLRDRHEDVKAGKRTLAVRFGGRFARVEYTLLVIAPYVLLALASRSSPDGRIGFLQPWLAIVPTAYNIKSVWAHDGAALNPFVGKSALAELLFCAHLAAMLVLPG
eukprot:scaffold1913_cov257-Pinguiococcus_pyrenoidosus.AAC.39